MPPRFIRHNMSWKEKNKINEINGDSFYFIYITVIFYSNRKKAIHYKNILFIFLFDSYNNGF